MKNVVTITSPKTGHLTRLVSHVSLVLLWLSALYAYSTSPDQVPLHFGFNGTPDRYGSRISILALPVIASLIFAGISFLIKRPQMLNYPVTVTETNRAGLYRRASALLNLLCLLIMAVFLFIIIGTYLVATGKMEGLGSWFLPVLIGVFGLFTISCFVGFSKKQNV